MVHQTWNELESLNEILAFNSYSDDDSDFEDEGFSKYCTADNNREWNQEASNDAIASFFDYESEDEDEIVAKTLAKTRKKVAVAAQPEGKTFGKMDHYNYKRGSFSKYTIGQGVTRRTPALSADFEVSKPVKQSGLPSLATLAFQVATVFSVMMCLQNAFMFLMNQSIAMTMAKSVVFLVLSIGLVIPRAYANMLRDFQSKKSINTHSASKVRVM